MELYPHGVQKIAYVRGYRTTADGTERTINSMVTAMHNSTAVEGCLIASSSGNVTSGTVDIWGVSK